ncbi:MAG: hypothetical protein AAGF30_00345 [Pseudomonadota bacterium]
MDIIEWPVDAMRVSAEDWHLVGQTLVSQGIYGPGTHGFLENRIWSVNVSLVHLQSSLWRAVRAVLDEARGQFGTIRVPVMCTLGLALGPVAFDGGVTFNGGARFGSHVPDDLVTKEALPAGASRVGLRGSLSMRLRLGTMFSLPGDALHRVARMDGDVAIVNPPLRRAVARGSKVEVLAPTALMRLTEDDGRLSRLASGHTAPTTLRLVEVLQ